MSKRSKILRKKKIEKDRTNREKVLGWLSRRLGYEIEKTESRIASFVFDPKPIIRKPEFDYVSLFEVGTTSWPLRRAFRAIIQESTRKEWDIAPRFKFKCVNEDCGEEYQTVPKDEEGKKKEKCIACNSELKKPIIEQKSKFRKLLKKPNRDYKFRSFVRSSIFYDLVLDDVYWSIAYRMVPKFENGKVVLDGNKNPIMVKEPAEFYVEDARFTFPVADEYGHLGGYEWYCSTCYGKGIFEDQDEPKIEILPNMMPDQQEDLKVCQYCGGEMTQTAYVEEVNGEVLARFGIDEIVHGSSSSVKPFLFGNSKIISVWKIVQTILAMDDYNFEVYSEGKVGSLIGFPGEDQLEVDEKKFAIEEEIKTLDGEDIQTGRYRQSKKVRTLFIGLKSGEKPIRIPIMEDLKAMQSLEFYGKYEDAVGEIYGVTPEFVAGSEPGKGTTMKVEVQDRTTEETQANFLDPFNNDLIIIFGITDWVLKFNPVEKRDELRDAQTLHTKMATMLTAARIDLDATIDETGEVKITGKANLVGGEGEGSRMMETPRSMGGKPSRQIDGEPTRTQGERLELRKTGVLPISWYSATEIKVFDKVYALNNDRDKVFVVDNGEEVKGTRESTMNLNYAVANLMEQILYYIKVKLTGERLEGFGQISKEIVQGLRRNLDLSGLLNLANYLEDLGHGEVAKSIDNLRAKLEKLEPSSLNVQPEVRSNSPIEEMIEVPDPKSKSIMKGKVPFGVEYKKESITKILNGILEWTKKEVKSGKKKERVIHKAKIKAIEKLNKHFEDLVSMGERHSEKSTNKKVGISPEELKRLERWKSNSLEDFEVILRDTLRRRRKRSA